MKHGVEQQILCDPSTSTRKDGRSSPYSVGPILRACEIIKAYRSEGESLFLRDLVARTGLNKTTVFRAAETLVQGGLLKRLECGRYATLITTSRHRRFRIGYASMTEKSLFARDVTESLRLSAAKMELELFELDNQMNARVALSNSERLIREQVDLAIEFQVCHRVAHVISSKFEQAHIPMIAVHTPHPGATFFGGNNYLAGRLGGRALAAWAKQTWNGRVDKVLLLGHAEAGPLTNSRLTGLTVGISDELPQLEPSMCLHIDCKGGYTETVDVIHNYLARSNARRILVGTINDSVALGALRAFQEAGREETCAVMSQNGTIGARNELRRKNTRLIGSVAFYPEKYGDFLLPLAVSMLTQKTSPRAFFMKHQLINSRNVDEYYPNDSLTSSPDPESMLFGRYH